MRNNRRKTDTSPLMEFIKKYWLVLVGVVMGFPILLRYLKDQETVTNQNNVDAAEKNIVIANQNPTTQLVGLNAITTRIELHDIARNVAFHLGTIVRTKEVNPLSLAFWNPRGWTENDQKAYIELNKINYAASRDLVTKCYYFLTRRNLIDDVKELLDDEYKTKLPLFK